VVVNLYPFAHTVAKGASADACVENVDIGGPCLLRAAAKNFRGVAVLSSPDQYATVSCFPCLSVGLPGEGGGGSRAVAPSN
jgi:AICAR transformylase/IMP cyclohydrolase PurH